MRLSIILTAVVASTSCTSPARNVSTPPTAQSALTSEIRSMDDSLSAVFNAHNADALMSLFARDVEFYHDTDGLENYEAVSAGFHRMLAGGTDMRRERVGALEVYPVKGYGAIQVGAHQFCHTENGRQICGTFRFLHLWRRESGHWQIARVMSYAH
jgi:ketosteroid isomerase-like protein